MTFGHFLQNIPNSGDRLSIILRAPNSMNKAKFLEATNDKWLKKNQRHFLGKAALVQFEFGANDDYGSSE